MAYVDIKRGYKHFSQQEILDFAYKGVLVCGDYELDGFLSYLMEGIDDIIEERIQAEKDKWESDFEDWDEEFK